MADKRIRVYNGFFLEVLGKNINLEYFQLPNGQWRQGIRHGRMIIRHGRIAVSEIVEEYHYGELVVQTTENGYTIGAYSNYTHEEKNAISGYLDDFYTNDDDASVESTLCIISTGVVRSINLNSGIVDIGYRTTNTTYYIDGNMEHYE